MEYIHGLMEGNIKGNIKTTKSMEWGHIRGQTVVSMWESGRMIKDMGEGNILLTNIM